MTKIVKKRDNRREVSPEYEKIVIEAATISAGHGRVRALKYIQDKLKRENETKS